MMMAACSLRQVGRIHLDKHYLTIRRFAGDASKPVMARADDLFEQAVSKLRGMVYTGYGAIEIMVRAGFWTSQIHMQVW